MASTEPPKAVTIHERCRIAPPSDGGAKQVSLPLVFFDMVWLHFHPIQRLIFYQFPCANEHFMETVVPNIKMSLSQTLKHFLPLAGNLIYPLESGNPEFRYIPGDSVSVAIAESNEASDFHYLTGDEPRDADRFHALVPVLPRPEIDFESGFKRIPVFAVQVTLFPDTGICLGFTNHHAVGDGSSIVGFIKAWSAVSMLGAASELSAANFPLPFYDRSVVKDQSGLGNTFWSQMNVSRMESLPLNFPTNRVRATYTLHKNDIQKLRNLVQAKKPGLVHLSSFTITTAYVWTCLVKSAAGAGEEVDDNEPEYFVFAVDARRRLDPPVPAEYFGNCVAFGMVESTHGQLKVEKGFSMAVELIGEVISKRVNNKDEILRDAGSWVSKFSELVRKRSMGVAGSPRFDLYDTEFGWGKPKKYEVVSIDGSESMSLCKSREVEGGLEIGLSLPDKKMRAFAAIFSAGLKI
ncbi:Malonyl-coenzyme:anthocyanin 5-O-glucoside-6'''-O-malonyltransferase [Sesamum angolense]|uniref:Malonyl-coenzyme:anthocyanin 5-O-glucoside-6'''-O-malonyltransferase n=1 Tax=Sesamum angolense TaxID=2727404 RepID=A0AAE1XG13_9LAMI|nr:Malonyl-coenzyme:anthocyanin 5-O-glucoside-6'''-O-malonyltransferase [Sesamum angolense]